MTPRLSRFSLPLLALPLLAAGCSLTDPTQAVGYWHPRGVNDGNLAVMVADPHDLVEGRGVRFSDGTLAAAAVDRLYRDKPRALPDTSLAVGASSSSSAAGGGAADTTP
jgi:hypothetical protein